MSYDYCFLTYDPFGVYTIRNIINLDRRASPIIFFYLFYLLLFQYI
jgi:hypothetical protein